MKSKRLIGLVLVGTMAVSSLAGCSKSKARKIDGASDDVASFIGVTEEIFDMKGVKTSVVMNIESDGNTETGELSTIAGTLSSVKGTITTDTLVDEAGNMSEKVSLDLKAGNYSVKGEVAKFSYIDNTVYIDLTGVYDIAVNLAGSATVETMLSYMQFTEEDVKKMLCLSISTGDLKATDFSMSKIKDITMKVNDDIAKALTDSKALTKDKDTYTITLNQETAKALSSAFATAFKSNASEIVKALIDTFATDEYKNKLVSFASALVGEVNKGIGGDMIATDDIKTQIEKMFSDIKDNKDSYVTKIVDAINNPSSDTNESADVDVSEVKIVVTDEKDGYSMSMDLDAKGSVSEMSAAVKSSIKATVASSTDKVTAPETSTSISEIVPKILTIVSMFTSSSLAE